MMRFISNLNQKVGDYSSLLYLIVFAVMIYDVAARYLISEATVWGLELVIALAGIQYVIAGGHAIKNDAHVRIDVIYGLLPEKIKKVMNILSHVLSFIFLAVIVYYGYQQAAEAVVIGERSGGGWNSMAPTYMKIAIPVGAALMAVQCLVQLAKALQRETHEQ